jgi:putative glycosyltransferase (TIGR04372 family)
VNRRNSPSLAGDDGDLEGRLRLLRRARRERQRAFAPASGKPPFRFLDGRWATDLGRMAGLARLVMRELLLGRDPAALVLYLPAQERPASAALLDKLAAHITVAREESALPLPRRELGAVLEEYDLCESLDGLTKFTWHAAAEIARAWEQAARPPLLSLSTEESAAGRARLQALGLPATAWFVCLHLGEIGSWTAPTAYLPAIGAIVERGGWVVIAGDTAMPPLPAVQGVVDYSHGRARSDATDLYVLAASRFFLGSASAAAQVPPLFGVPCVLTDWSPAGLRPLESRDLYLPRLWRNEDTGTHLGLAETFAPPLGYAAGYAAAMSLDLAPVPSSPEETRELVEEMLDRLPGTASYTERDGLLRAAYDTVAETNLCRGNARPGRDFLRRFAPLLTGPATIKARNDF